MQSAQMHTACRALLPAGLGAKHCMTTPTDRLSRTGLVFQFPERHFLASTLQQVTRFSQHSVASNILWPATCSRRPASPLKRLQALYSRVLGTLPALRWCPHPRSNRCFLCSFRGWCTAGCRPGKPAWAEQQGTCFAAGSAGMPQKSLLRQLSNGFKQWLVCRSWYLGGLQTQSACRC